MAMLGRNGIVVVFIACVIGAAAGWFAERAWGKSKCENVEVCKCANVKVCKCGNVETANGGRARRSATADAAAEKPNVTEAELAALRDKAAALDKELKDLLDARERKAKADAQKKGGDDSKKDKPEVSEDEALEKCETYGELKRRYPNVWKQWHGKMSGHAKHVLEKYDNWRTRMSELDVSSMTDEERESHARMMEIYERKHALMRETELCGDDEMTVARFKENRDEMYRLAEEGRKLMAVERNTLLRITAENLGRRLGWQEADTAEFTETLRAIGDATSGDMTN